MAEGLIWQLPDKRVRRESGIGYEVNNVGMSTSIIKARQRFREKFNVPTHTVRVSPYLDGWPLQILRATFEHVVVDETACSSWRDILLQDGGEDEEGGHDGNERN